MIKEKKKKILIKLLKLGHVNPKIRFFLVTYLFSTCITYAKFVIFFFTQACFHVEKARQSSKHPPSRILPFSLRRQFGYWKSKFSL